MLGATILMTMFRYDHDKNEQLLALAERVTAHEWSEPQPSGQRSLHETLFHILAVVEEYLVLCETGQATWGARKISDYPDAASLRTFNDKIYATYLPTLERLTDEQLMQRITSVMPHGVVQSVVMWQILVHMLYHSQQHRSEVASMLTRYGHSPGFIDFFGFGDWGVV